MAATVEFVNRDDNAQRFTVFLFGPDKNRVKVASILRAFKASMAIMDDGKGSLMEADDDGLSMHTFVGGDSYTLLLRPQAAGEEEERSAKRLKAFGTGFSGSKPRKTKKSAPQPIVDFVQLAAKSYKEWEEECKKLEQDCKQALDEVDLGVDEVDSGVTEKMRRCFLKVRADPLLNFPNGFLLWVRNCYTEMKDIISAAEGTKCSRFTILGTSGIGKSTFTVFWICYRATLKEKVVWKMGGIWYLLDFTVEDSPMAYKVKEADILEVLNDVNGWLIIDGAQSENLVYPCHILQACSVKKDNYHEYSKNLNVRERYFPVWEKDEVCDFLDEFEHYRSSFPDMKVHTKDAALGYFEKIGGVPRYVLFEAKSEVRLAYIEAAVGELSQNICLEYLAGDFGKGDKSNALVHIKCGQAKDKKYSTKIYDFASVYLRSMFRERFHALSKVEVVNFLRKHASSSDAGNTYGYVFELVAHELIKRGGEYRMKKVTKGAGAEGVEVPCLKLPKQKVVPFDSWKMVARLEEDSYYQPTCGNLKSVDAFLHPNLLLQYFSYNHGDHGFIVQGLVDADAALQLRKYKVCSCVPMDKYDKTGFQPWFTTKGTTYKAELPQMIKDSEQYVIEVDYEKFSSSSVGSI